MNKKKLLIFVSTLIFLVLISGNVLAYRTIQSSYIANINPSPEYMLYLKRGSVDVVAGSNSIGSSGSVSTTTWPYGYRVSSSSRMYGITHYYSADDNDWHYKNHRFNVAGGTNGKFYLMYRASKDDEGHYFIRVQKYYSGRWNTVWGTSSMTFWDHPTVMRRDDWAYDAKGNRRVKLSLSPGTYRLATGVFTSSHGFWGSDSEMGIQYRADRIELHPPEVKTNNLYFNETQTKTEFIRVDGGEGDLRCDGLSLISGMSLTATDTGCNLRWRPGYHVNKNTSSGYDRQRIRIRVTDAKNQRDYKYLNVYIKNRPYPISNISPSSYKEIRELPDKPSTLNYDSPTIPKFDSSGTLSSISSLTKLSSYSFETVSVAPPHPGDNPFIKSGVSASLTLNESTINQITNSLEKENVKGHDNLKKIIEDFVEAREAYKSMEEFLDKQYDVPENDKDLYYDGLDKVVDYNRQTNILNKNYTFENDTDYKNIKKIYDALNDKLEERQNKLDHNNEQYDKYKQKINEYNNNLTQEIDKFINEFRNNYIPVFNDWESRRTDYLNLLYSRANSYDSYNQNLYNNKVNQINTAIRNYGLTSIQVSDVPKKPNVMGYYSTINSNFDSATIPNLYESVENYGDLSSSTKTEIKNLFADRNYTSSKFNTLRNILIDDLEVDIVSLEDYNEDYLLE